MYTYFIVYKLYPHHLPPDEQQTELEESPEGVITLSARMTIPVEDNMMLKTHRPISADIRDIRAIEARITKWLENGGVQVKHLVLLDFKLMSGPEAE